MESGESIRCNGPRNLRKTGACAAIAFFLVAWACEASALEGRVIDGSTGRPLPGVYVIGAWRVGGGLVIANTSCAKLDLQHTDAEGNFKLPSSTGRILSRVFGSESLSVYYYKPGYHLASTDLHAAGAIALVPHQGPTWDRLQHISDIMEHADCGDDQTSMANRLELFRAMYRDAASFVVTPKERVAAAKILYAIESVEQGEPLARKQLEIRERAAWQRP